LEPQNEQSTLDLKKDLEYHAKAYMQIMRLNGVFQELRTTRSKHMVSSIGADWEFNYLGRFSKQYRRMFGELPSETPRIILLALVGFVLIVVKIQ